MKRRSLLTICASILGLEVCPAAEDKPDPIVGKWRSAKGTKSQRVVVFRANRTCYYYYPGVSSIGGKWTVSAKDNRRYDVVWGGGTRDEEFRIGEDDKLRNSHGKIIAERYVE